MTRLRIDDHGFRDEASKTKAELLRRVNAEAAANWNNPQWRYEMAREMFTTIYRGFDFETLIDRMLVTERVGRGDAVYVKEVRGLKVFWVSRGGQIDQSTLNRNVQKLPRDILGYHVQEADDKMESGFGENQQELVALAIKQMDAELNLWILRLFQAAIPDATSASYNEGNGLTLSVLKTMIREVEDETEDGAVTVMARSTMMGQVWDALEDSNNFTPETNEQLRLRGMIGVYHNATMWQLKNFRNDLEISVFPANELYVFAKDSGKVAFYGGMKGEEWSEQGGFYWHSQGEREVGALIFRPERAQRFVDLDTPAFGPAIGA